jgi:hypothetical protein
MRGRESTAHGPARPARERGRRKRTLKSIDEDLGGIARGWHRAEEGTVKLIRIRGRVEGQTLDATSPHTAAAAAAT